MDFNSFSKRYDKIKSPIKSHQKGIFSEKGISNLVTDLKQEDSKSKRTYYLFYIFYSIMASLFLLVIVFDTGIILTTRLAIALYLVAFTILIISFRMKYYETKNINYLSSPKQFLIEAQKRFSFWNNDQLILIPVILIINVGASLFFTRYIGEYNLIIRIFIFQICFWGVLAIFFHIGRRDWKKNKKPILNEIEKMLAGFEDEN